MKHTPGPWSVNVIGQHWNNKSLKHIEVTFGQDGECICDTVYNPSDAKLISAAPDLLNALQAILNKAYKQNWNEQYPDEVSKAQAAISKALGGGVMKRSDADVISQKSYSSAETRNTVSHLQAAESLHEISVKTPTLRDYFAAKFAVVYIGNCYSHPALDAYKMADKMLEARNMSTEDIEAYEKKLAEDMGEDIPW